MARPSIVGSNLTAEDVLAYAARISRTRTDVGVNFCQRFVRNAFGAGPGAPTAYAAWQGSRFKHSNGTPPPGAAVYWGGGAGHVAISAGNGMVYSTDVREPGKVDLVDINWITQQWGKQYLGWSEDNNGKRIVRFNAQPVTDGAGAGDKWAPLYAGNSTTAADGNTRYSKKELRERYGYAAAFFESSPELQKLLQRAVRGQWTPEEFEARFRASKWYRKHSEAEKAWVLLSTSEPGEAKRQVTERTTELRAMYRQMGVAVGPKRLEKIATQSLVHSWSETEIRNALTAEFEYKPDSTYGGVAGQTIDEFKAMSNAYLVPMSASTMERWTEHVLRGEATPDDFESYLKTQAKSLFPELGDAIDRGHTVDQYLDPYREMAARELEMSPADVDWFDPKWSQAVFRTDDKGQRQVMGLADWQRTLRTDDRLGWDRTSGAMEAAAGLGESLGKLFGKVA